MLKFIFILLILYFFIRMFTRAFLAHTVKKNQSSMFNARQSNLYQDRFDKSTKKSNKPFDNIEEADFIEIDETDKDSS